MQDREAFAGRREDRRLVTGAGCFTADACFADVAHAKFLRSSRAHAEILSIDTTEARRVPGVLAVFTAHDVAADGLPDIPQNVDLRRPDGSGPLKAARPLLAREFVRHLGEPVVMVIAETEAAAADALERVVADYGDLPAVATPSEALSPGATPVWPDAPDGVGFVWRHGDAAAVEAALQTATHRIEQKIRVSRVAVNPMEMRAAVGSLDSAGRLVLHIGHQQPYVLRDALAHSIFRIAPERIRVVSSDVGGSFGLKTGLHSEEILVLWAARRLGRAVRWVADRSETFLGDDQARDVDITVSLGLDADARFTSLKVRYDLNVGCYISPRSVASINNIGGVAGVYRTPLIAAEVFGVMTNTAPTGPYRGAGRPEATLAIERIVDIAARELDIDPFELRYRNLISADEMPFKTGLTFTYDCGDFAGNMTDAAKLADFRGFSARRAEAARRGRLRGLGIANLIETAGGPFGRPVGDSALLQLRSDGTALLHSGMMSTGQGIVTALSRLVGERLGVPAENIEVCYGDTDDGLPKGRGNGGSSALSVSGSTVNLAVDQIIEQARALAADHLETSADDLDFRDGHFRVVGTDRTCSLAELTRVNGATASSRDVVPILTARAEFQPPQVTYPNGCHICEVEIDPETGVVEVIRYSAVEDIGRVLNPVLVEGQLQGGIAQGIGQALMEEVAYESASGQLRSGSFMDYAMPRASDMPAMQTVTRPIPTAVNPLGVKGVGEAGTVGSLAVTMNAICDALAQLGIRHFDMPATPDRIWAAIRARKDLPKGD